MLRSTEWFILILLILETRQMTSLMQESISQFFFFISQFLSFSCSLPEHGNFMYQLCCFVDKYIKKQLELYSYFDSLINIISNWVDL